MNKVDVIRPEELSEENKELLKVFDQEGNNKSLIAYYNNTIQYSNLLALAYGAKVSVSIKNNC